MCHAATRTGGFVFIFLKNFQFFKKNKNKPPFPLQRGTLSTQVKSWILPHCMNKLF
jgi:hypothetical protein